MPPTKEWGDLNLQANELNAQGHFDVVRDGTRYRGQNAGSAYLYRLSPLSILTSV